MDATLSQFGSLMLHDGAGANDSTASLLELLQGLAFAPPSRESSPTESYPSTSDTFSLDSSLTITDNPDVAVASADNQDGLEFIEDYKEQLAQELVGAGVEVIPEADKPARLAELVKEFGPFPESAGPETFLAEVPGTVTLVPPHISTIDADTSIQPHSCIQSSLMAFQASPTIDCSSALSCRLFSREGSLNLVLPRFIGPVSN
jgi:hypothetical protein